MFDEYHGAMAPWYHGTMVPWLPWHHGAMVPWYQAPGTRDQGPGGRGVGREIVGDRGGSREIAAEPLVY